MAVAINDATATNLAYVGASNIAAGGLAISATSAARDLTFDPTSKVSIGDNTIDAGASGLRTGDAVVYQHGGGGTDIGGLTDGKTYYVNVQEDGKLKLYDTRAHALAGGTTGVKDLSGTLTGIGSAHKLVDESDSFGAQATSGAGGGKTGVAGSLAINIGTTDTEAELSYGGSASTLTIQGGGDITLSAGSDVFNTASALPSDGGGDGSKVGVGASIAFNYGENSTLAQVGDGTVFNGGHLDMGALTLTATSAQDMVTEAKNGAKGSTAITPVVAISISNNDTEATLGSGAQISIGGDFSAQASLTSKVDSSAVGDTESDSTGVGISIALTVANDSSVATTGRSLSADGAMTFSATTISGSSSSATASVAGGTPDDGSGSHDGANDQSVTNDTNKEMGFADSKSKETNSSAKGTGGESAPDSSTSDGQVSVAGAVGVNIETRERARLYPGFADDPLGRAAHGESAANVDGSATASGSAVLGAIEFDPTGKL